MWKAHPSAEDGCCLWGEWEDYNPSTECNENAASYVPTNSHYNLCHCNGFTVYHFPSLFYSLSEKWDIIHAICLSSSHPSQTLYRIFHRLHLRNKLWSSYKVHGTVLIPEHSPEAWIHRPQNRIVKQSRVIRDKCTALK